MNMQYEKETGQPLFSVLPEEAPLAMPAQRFDRLPGVKPREPATAVPHIWLRRLLLIAGTLLLSAIALKQMFGVAAEGGLTFSKLLLLALFVPLFSWIAFSFVGIFIGFLSLMLRRSDGLPIAPLGQLRSRNAILMPVYNEDISAVIARLRYMAEGLLGTGEAEAFDIFILSDTTDQLIRRAEKTAYLAAFESFPVPLYYRVRHKNIARKPGNIAEWVQRFGGRYQHMVVLDADSIVGGETLVRLAATMERNPGVALLQTMPTVINSKTLFARWQQFAGRLYGPIASAGLVWWSGSEASFWGHNAIIRTRAFAECAALPRLSGKEPIGGAILSHDMVEAAMLRRRGWAVHMADLPDSHEEFPPTTLDHGIRDRRWCQGNLQHVRLLRARGFHWVNRLQLLMGVSAYLTSPMWLLLLVIGLWAIAGQGSFHDLPDIELTIGITLVLLFGPKLLALIHALTNGARRRAFGGARRLVASVAIETLLAMLMAPMVMWTQSVMFADLLRGRSSGWVAQRRDSDGIELKRALHFYRSHVAAGAALMLAAWIFGQSFIWTLPVALGLLLSPFLCSATSFVYAGELFARAGLFLTPDEWRRYRVRPLPPLRAEAERLAGKIRGQLEGLQETPQRPDPKPGHRRAIETPVT